jgi:L-alanine-DL-glutamate epimerase-like enolase superfamily enzyme
VRGLTWDPFEAGDLPLETRDLERMLETVAAVRDTVGDDADLFIEEHGRFDVPTAIRVSRTLEQCNPILLQEPHPPASVDALAGVRSKSPATIAADEGDVLIPDGVGLGIELDLEAIAEHPYSAHPMRIFSDPVAHIRPSDARSYFNQKVPDAVR